LDHQSDEPIGIERLPEALKCANSCGEVVGRVHRCRHDDDRCPGPGVSALSEEIESAEPRHVAVGDYDIEMSPVQFRQRLQTITGLYHCKADLFQSIGDTLPYILIVVDDQHACSISYHGVRQRTRAKDTHTHRKWLGRELQEESRHPKTGPSS
jgi:hypothetical protein